MLNEMLILMLNFLFFSKHDMSAVMEHQYKIALNLFPFS